MKPETEQEKYYRIENAKRVIVNREAQKNWKEMNRLTWLIPLAIFGAVIFLTFGLMFLVWLLKALSPH